MCGEIRLEVVDISPPEGCNIILAQSHFIKTVEDVYEALVESCPTIKFGLAFCESSGKRLIRHAGNDPDLEKEATERAKKLAAGHTLVILIKDAWPINVIHRLRAVSEIVTLFAATANPLQVIVAETDRGRGVLGVIDGQTPLGVEGDEDIKEREEFLRKIGYKF
ncbi:MAG TPA: adenosine monophosphate-protein transferase [Candidatus Korarchaeota archaeon]|nr:adenosine monophosphate-protein transferase [Candidatus Korarchaeota archaeon]